MPHHHLLPSVLDDLTWLPAATTGRTTTSTFGLVVSVVVTIGVVVLILLFEKRRAKQIEHDLRPPRRRPSPRPPTEPRPPTGSGEHRDDGGAGRE